MSGSLWPRRLKREHTELINDCPVGINAEPISKNNLSHWQAVILGPEGSDYEGGTYYLDYMFSEGYPFKPPSVRFLTPILHPNVNSKSGDVCLMRDWNVAWTISRILLVVRALMSDPDPHDPVDAQLAELYLTNRKAYQDMVRKHVHQHAICNKDVYSLKKDHKPPKQPAPVCSLMVLCRTSIRSTLWLNNQKDVDQNTQELPLPKQLKTFMLVGGLN